MELNVGVADRIIDRAVPEENEILIVVLAEEVVPRPIAVVAVRDPVRQAGHPVTPILTVLVHQADLALPSIPIRVLLPKRSKISNPNSKWRNRMARSPCPSRKPTSCVLVWAFLP